MAVAVVVVVMLEVVGASFGVAMKDVPFIQCFYSIARIVRCCWACNWNVFFCLDFRKTATFCPLTASCVPRPLSGLFLSVSVVL